MNTAGFEFGQRPGRNDDESCFGFHSEYYIGRRWEKSWHNGNFPHRGYVGFSKYLDDIYTLFTISAHIPHGPSYYFETFDDHEEVRGIKVPCGKRLLVKGILKVDLRTGEYEVPEEYTVKKVRSK